MMQVNYVQDERYAAGAGSAGAACVRLAQCRMCGTIVSVMFRMNGMPRAQGCAGAACFSFAHCFGFCMGAEVARYLSSGLATSTSVWARARHPCRSRSESKVPHTLCAVRNHSAMVSKRCNPAQALVIRRAYLSESTVFRLPTKPRGCGVLFQDRTRQEVEFAPPWMGSRHVLK